MDTQLSSQLMKPDIVVLPKLLSAIVHVWVPLPAIITMDITNLWLNFYYEKAVLKVSG